ncbi:L-seryl-tRNA(Sec) selenium transferase [Heliorestis acidaminivorans]|uniref:L-seryl-tRNA(Sec) selenium transferase n=1 Tax=Heliorestis acidaminivorans TaxID=553427 RepID=A0A6I0EWH5_9FIRM|nr:L-seryl-tRNA(Sec) selenium transferase [Heliorestis acidaminivorans]KAB2954139.1 L-seryl-tRNA(Sec) selenium transferase [Heliorestis acidaminivorans]
MAVENNSMGLRNLPAVHQVLGRIGADKLLQDIDHSQAVKIIQGYLEKVRSDLIEGKVNNQDKEQWLNDICSDLKNILLQRKERQFRRVINGTGVILHTNLGRAPLAEEALSAIVEVAQGYSNLEFDITSGKRGKRYDHVRTLLRELTGAEDALVVNNNAAAILLVLSSLAKNREVIISRGELVEIGGSFRVPDVMAQSGAIMIEVGTTNKTKLRDYQEAVTEATALLLKVHPSNYKVIGFTESVERSELVKWSHSQGIPVVEDLGSGVFFNQSGQGDFFGEPTVQKVVASNVDVVTFSGDKLLGGPQAGIIVGRKKLIDKIAQHPLTRALRVDKLTLAALEATLKLYAEPEKAKKGIPTLYSIYRSLDELEKRAQAVAKIVRDFDATWKIEVEAGNSQIGGGSLPELALPSRILRITSDHKSTYQLSETLRALKVPIIGRLHDKAFCIDMRTIGETEEKELCKMLQLAFEKMESCQKEGTNNG